MKINELQKIFEAISTGAEPLIGSEKSLAHRVYMNIASQTGLSKE